jgi:hypothetical protein
MTCRLCGAPTSRRLCRQCEIEERAEERARARARLDEEADKDDDDDDGKEPTVLPDGGTVDIGELHAAAVLNHDGQAVLTIKGTEGGVRLHVPEEMVGSCQHTADELERFYSEQTSKTLIGDGGRVETCPECGDACSCRRTPESPDSHARGEGQGSTKALTETPAGDLRPDGGTTLSSTDIDRLEAERRARQAARSLDEWSRCARLGALEILREETSIPFEVSNRGSGEHTEPPQRSTDHVAGPTLSLICQDCPFAALSSGDEARKRLEKARDVHRTAFDHEVVIDHADDDTDCCRTAGGDDQ